MAVSNGYPGSLFEGASFEGCVRTVAAPSWVRPCFGIALVNLGPGSNALFVQEVDSQDRITGLSLFDVPGEGLFHLNKPVLGLSPGSPAIHAFIGPDGEVLAGDREELAQRIAPWLPKIGWPVTRLAFADFVGDEAAIMAAADAALKQKSERYGRHEASVWFATSVIFRRLQRSVLEAASSEEHRLELEAALDQTHVGATDTDIVAWLPPTLIDLFDGANIRAKPELSMALKLAMLVSPKGLSMVPVEDRSTATVYSHQSKGNPESLPGGAFSDLWVNLQSDPNDVFWPLRWKHAWDTSHGHPDFETLGLNWLVEQERPTTGPNGGLILATLFEDKYRPVDTASLVAAAERWLEENSVLVPRWGRVWIKVADSGEIPDHLVKPAFAFLKEADQKTGSYHIWLRIWAILKQITPQELEKLDCIAAQALPRFNKQPGFVKRVAIPLFNPERPTDEFPEIWDWFQGPENRGNGWAEFYLYVLNVRAADFQLIEMGKDWLEANPMTGRRWPRIWRALYDFVGPDSRLISLGKSYMAIPPIPRRESNLVSDILAAH